MTTEEGLLAEIVASPDDDLVRLAYCDWLEENEEQSCLDCGGKGWAYQPWKESAAGYRAPAAILMHPADSLGPEGETLYKNECRPCHGSGRLSRGRRERAEFIRTQIELNKPCTACKGAGEYDDDHGGMMTCRGCWGKKTMRNWAFSGVGHVALLNREKELWNESRLNGAPHPWVPVPAGFKGTAN